MLKQNNVSKKSKLFLTIKMFSPLLKKMFYSSVNYTVKTTITSLILYYLIK